MIDVKVISVTIILMFSSFLIGGLDQKVKFIGPTQITGTQSRGSNVDGHDHNTRDNRALDCTNWLRTPITVDGNASDWTSNYTGHNVGRAGKNVMLYMANDDEYLYVCIDVISDQTNEESVNDHIRLWFDGDNDNSVVSPIGSTTNESTTDNWIILNGNESARSDTNGIANDAGWLNTGGGIYGDPGVYVSMWYDAYAPYLQNRFVDYMYKVGFNGTPAHMVYEIGFPMERWNWSGGDQIGSCLLVWEHGDNNAIGIWPAGLNPSNVAGWKDIFLATPNDLPFYSNPTIIPNTILNDNQNTSLIAIEAGDPDGHIIDFTMDLSQIGGASQTQLLDDGTHGDVNADDGIFSYEFSVPTIIDPGEYTLPFTLTDNHTPNTGMITGEVNVTVAQYNRNPIIDDPSFNVINMNEDQRIAYFNITPIFSDPDPEDNLTYFIRNGTLWDHSNRSLLADYQVHMNGTLSIVPLPDRFGVEHIELTAQDPHGLMLSNPHSIAVSIQRVNDLPFILNVNGTYIPGRNISLDIWEDRWSEFNFTADDIDNDPLTWEINISDEIPGMKKDKDYEFQAENGSLRIKGANHHVGNYSLNLTVEDGNDGMDFINIYLNISNTNDPPHLRDIDDDDVFQDEWMMVLPQASDDDLIHGDKLRFSTNFSKDFPGVLTLDNFMFNNTTGEFRFRPDKTMVGTYATHIMVRDRNLNYSRKDFSIRVVNRNDPPTEPIFEYSVDHLNMTVNFTIIGSIDPDGDELSYQLDFGDQSPGDYLKTFYPGCYVEHQYRKPGNYSVRLWVSDGTSTGVNTSTLIVSIKDFGQDKDDPVNPNIIPAGDYELAGTVIDADGAPLSDVSVNISYADDQTKWNLTSTDQFGSFQLFLPSGVYSIELSKEGYINRTATLDINDRDKTMEFILLKVGQTEDDINKDNADTESSFDYWLVLIVLAMMIILVLILILLVVFKKRGKDEVHPEKEEIIAPDAVPPVSSDLTTSGQDSEIIEEDIYTADNEQEFYSHTEGSGDLYGKIPLDETESASAEFFADLQVEESDIDGNYEEPEYYDETQFQPIEGKTPQEDAEVLTDLILDNPNEGVSTPSKDEQSSSGTYPAPEPFGESELTGDRSDQGSIETKEDVQEVGAVQGKSEGSAAKVENTSEGGEDELLYPPPLLPQSGQKAPPAPLRAPRALPPPPGESQPSSDSAHQADLAEVQDILKSIVQRGE